MLKQRWNANRLLIRWKCPWIRRIMMWYNSCSGAGPQSIACKASTDAELALRKKSALFTHSPKYPYSSFE
eukprot:880962-Rhodomonas_salina.2